MKLTQTQIPISKSIGGAAIELSLYELTSTGHGPSVYLQASVHGAEVQGNATLYELIALIKENELKGTVRFIPLANPLATNQKRGTATNGRYDPITGNNWNRGYFNFEGLGEDQWTKLTTMLRSEIKDSFSVEAKVLFKKWMRDVLAEKLAAKNSGYSLSYEKTLLYTLQREALANDIVIDLHTGPVACEYLYAPMSVSERARDLHAQLTLLVPYVFAGAMDEACFMPWHLLGEKLAALSVPVPAPFEAYTMELGSEEYIDFKKARSQARRIAHLLFKRGVLARDPLEETDRPSESFEGPISNYKTIFAPRAGLYDYRITPGQLVESGTLLCEGIELPFAHGLESWEQNKFSLHCPSKAVIVNYSPTGIVSEGMELIQMLEL